MRLPAAALGCALGLDAALDFLPLPPTPPLLAEGGAGVAAAAAAAAGLRFLPLLGAAAGLIGLAAAARPLHVRDTGSHWTGTLEATLAHARQGLQYSSSTQLVTSGSGHNMHASDMLMLMLPCIMRCDTVC